MDINPPKTKVEFTISITTVIKIIGVLVALWFLYYIRDIIAMFFVALILSSIIDPLADWFEVRRVPRAIAVLVLYLVIFSILGLFIGVLVPPLIQEVRDLASNFSTVWERLVSGVQVFREYSVQNGFSKNIENSLAGIQTTLTGALGGIFGTIIGFFGGVVSFVLILVLTFYMVVQEDGLKKLLKVLVPDQYQSFSSGTFSKVQRKITAWVKGQLALSAVVGLAVYIGLSIIGVNYALVLGLFAGVMEIVPYVGPFLSGIVAIFFALSQSTTQAFFTLVMFVVIQQMENNILVPKVMQKAVGLNPIISILALVIGAKLGGMVGVIFAIPLTTALDVVAREIMQGGRSKP